MSYARLYFSLWVSCALWLPSSQAQAASVVCHITYGGETRQVNAAPVASPYEVKAIQVGSYFLFRAVVQDSPPDIAAIKLYVYGDTDDGPVLIHQVDYSYPPATSKNTQFGFTGLHRVYEKIRDGELEYWCEFLPAVLPARKPAK
jgi:hypothetical protein